MAGAEQQAAGQKVDKNKPERVAEKPVSGGLLHMAKQQQAAADKEAAREGAITAYRQQKRQHAGGATMASLGKLAAQGAERLKQQQQAEEMRD